MEGQYEFNISLYAEGGGWKYGVSNWNSGKRTSYLRRHKFEL
jgi:hypothetical protein